MGFFFNSNIIVYKVHHNINVNFEGHYGVDRTYTNVWQGRLFAGYSCFMCLCCGELKDCQCQTGWETTHCKSISTLWQICCNLVMTRWDTLIPPHNVDDLASEDGCDIVHFFVDMYDNSTRYPHVHNQQSLQILNLKWRLRKLHLKLENVCQ